MKDNLICFLFKYLLLGHLVWIFFFNFSKKVGRSGDGKRTILLEWPYFHIIFRLSQVRMCVQVAMPLG